MSDTSKQALRPRAVGFFHDDLVPDGAWLRERAFIRLPALPGLESLRLRGQWLRHPEARGIECRLPSLRVRVGIAGRQGYLRSYTLHASKPQQEARQWTLDLALPPVAEGQRLRLEFELGGVGTTNALAWLGRVTGFGFAQRFRRQACNRQLRLQSLETGAGELICDFSRRSSPFSAAYLRGRLQVGMNIAGFLCADLGIGESARCMVRAADAAGIPTALVPLRLPCKNPQSDRSLEARLGQDNPHPVNVVHIDPPVSGDLDHHQGAAFRAGKYNVGYWAWELPDFPEDWVEACRYFDEIWCPSDFVREAISLVSPLPVITMPHAIEFPRPQGSQRVRFGLPEEAFVFLFAYDLNSYSERKNPRAVIKAFRSSGLAGRGAVLAIKVHNVTGNEKDFAELKQELADLPDTCLIAETLSREDFYRLEASCDCFMSLHRSEGFGLAVAECMYLGKPVISTDWSATSEYLHEGNGCPVRYALRTLERNHGPYMKGSRWAEPDTEHAAEWMRRLFEDRELAARLGAAARAQIEELFSPSAIGARYRRRLEALALAP